VDAHSSRFDLARRSFERVSLRAKVDCVAVGATLTEVAVLAEVRIPWETSPFYMLQISPCFSACMSVRGGGHGARTPCGPGQVL